MNPSTVADLAFYSFFCYQLCIKRFIYVLRQFTLLPATMFSDSDVAKKITISQTKALYSVIDGLGDLMRKDLSKE